jgi:hypothetical protein
MDLFDSDDSLYEDDVFGVVSKNYNQDFKPWHKPRKQYIRDKQWLGHFKRLLSNSKYRSIDSINYFGLPGGDLLDINYLYEGMEGSSKSKNKSLGFHGFINSEVDYSKAQGEVSKLLDKKRVHANSKIEKFNFEDLMKPNSDAWSRVKNFGVYHFINLDFCNNVMSLDTLLSIYNLLEYQMTRVIGLPWLLCMTTRLSKDSASDRIIEKFKVIVNEFIGSDILNRKIEECFSEAYEYINKYEDIVSIDNKIAMNQVLQICLVLWILKEAAIRDNAVSLKSSFKYSVNLFEREMDMHSFVFCFEKQEMIQSDVLGLSPAQMLETKKVDFTTVAAEALDKLSSSLDVDSHLDSDTECLNYYTDEMMSWLERCGYDTTVYRQFMADNYGYKF